MQQQKHSRRVRRKLSHRPPLLILLGGAALLGMLVITTGGSARAAPQSGAPTLTIVSITGSTLTLQLDGWTLNETVTLNYSPNQDCNPRLSLPDTPTFTITSNPLQVDYTWPSGIQPGTYYLCATGTEGTVASQQPISINNSGIGQSTPGPGTPGSTPTGGSPTPSATSSPGASPSPTSGAAGTPGATSTPGNQGTSASSNSGNTLVAIILLCLLVMALLAYLIRLWLQGRQPGSQSPGSGKQGP